jgi:hypothetical protein
MGNKHVCLDSEDHKMDIIAHIVLDPLHFDDPSISHGSGLCLFARLYRRRVGLEALPCFQVPRHEGGSLSDGAPKRKEGAREGIILLHCQKPAPIFRRYELPPQKISSISEDPHFLVPDNGQLYTLQKLGASFFGTRTTQKELDDPGLHGAKELLPTSIHTDNQM